jgi:hypothetical protein
MTLPFFWIAGPSPAYPLQKNPPVKDFEFRIADNRSKLCLRSSQISVLVIFTFLWCNIHRPTLWQ